MDLKVDARRAGASAPPAPVGVPHESEPTPEHCIEVLEGVPVGVVVMSARGGPLLANAAARRVLGPELLEDVGLGELVRRYRAYRAGTDSPCTEDALPLVRALRGEWCSAQNIELRHRDPPLRLTVWASPVRNSAGQITSAMAAFVDSEADIGAPELALSHGAALDRRARHERQLEALGRLAAGVAHEINTPMQYIGDNTTFLGTTVRRLLELTGAFERLLEQCKAGSVAAADLEEYDRELRKARITFLRAQAPSAIEQSLAGVDQVRAIVQALKEFAHPGEPERAPVDLSHLARTAATVTRNSWRYYAELALELGEDVPTVMGHATELGQVLINLIVNAADAIEERIRSGQSDPPGRIVVRTLRVGHDAVVEVEDNGAGVPDAVRDRILEPFFTTKAAGKGTGQGLALARRVVVEEHGGELSFSSAVGRGTTFCLRLPGTRHD